MQKITIISYSWTNNNAKLAKAIAKNIGAKELGVKELKKRSNFTIALDLIFKRTAKTDFSSEKVNAKDFIVFMSPIWMGMIAFPLNDCFKKLKGKVKNYAFISISGGATGPNDVLKIEESLIEKLGEKPKLIKIFHKAELDAFKGRDKIEIKETMDFKIDEKDVEMMAKEAARLLKDKI